MNFHREPSSDSLYLVRSSDTTPLTDQDNILVHEHYMPPKIQWTNNDFDDILNEANDLSSTYPQHHDPAFYRVEDAYYNDYFFNEPIAPLVHVPINPAPPQWAPPDLDPSFEFSGPVASHATPGTIYLLTSGLKSRVCGSLNLNPACYSNPRKVHEDVVKTIGLEWNKNTYPKREYRKRRNPDISENEWRPLSVFTAYTNVKVENTDDLENIPADSCFGKVNMRKRRAWQRGPNKRRSL